VCMYCVYVLCVCIVCMYCVYVLCVIAQDKTVVYYATV